MGLLVLFLAALALYSTPAAGQELAPRAYWPGPKGINVFSVGYSFTDGDVLVDPSLPVDGVVARTHAVSLAYHRILGLAGRTASLTLGLPLADAAFEAGTESATASASESGLGDLQVRLGVNLLGAPTMTPQEFQQYRQAPARHVLGASLKVQVPTGEFNADRVANVGASRWSVKPELGYIHPFGARHRWVLESVLGVWLYGDNEDFRFGRLEQRPMLGLEIHLVRRISPGKWISLDWNYYQGGRTTVAGDQKDNRQENSRIGVTFAFPIKRHVFKVAFSESLRVKEGGDYLGVLLGYSYAWN